MTSSPEVQLLTDVDYVLQYEGTIDKLNKIWESIRFTDVVGKDGVLLDERKKLFRSKSEVPVLSESFRSSFNESAAKDKRSFVTQSVHLKQNSFALSKQFNRSQLTTLNQRNHIRLPPIPHLNAPTLKIVIENNPVNSLKHVPDNPLLSTGRTNRNAVFRKIEAYQLKNPEVLSAKFDISDLLKNLEQHNDKHLDYASNEWLKICKLLDRHRAFLRQLFIGYNLNYLQRILKLEFRPDHLHLEKVARMNYVVYRKLCSDMRIDLDEHTMMQCFYLSSRQLKELPSNLWPAQ